MRPPIVSPALSPTSRRASSRSGVPASLSNAPLATGRPAQPPLAPMVTLRIDGGKTDKLRPGDILGALTGEAGLSGASIGKIAIFPTRSYVAIARQHLDKALRQLEAGRIKGKRFRVRPL